MSDEVAREQRAAMLRRLERVTAELEKVKRQRNDLALKLSAHTGRTWENELADVGVEHLDAGRDPGPSAVVPMDSLPSFRDQFTTEGRPRWSEAAPDGTVTVHWADDVDDDS